MNEEPNTLKPWQFLCLILFLIAIFKIVEYQNKNPEQSETDSPDHVTSVVPTKISASAKKQQAFQYWKNSCKYIDSHPEIFTDFKHNQTKTSLYSFLDQTSWGDTVYHFSVSITDDYGVLPYELQQANVAYHTCEYLVGDTQQTLLTYKELCQSLCQADLTANFIR